MNSYEIITENENERNENENETIFEIMYNALPTYFELHEFGDIIHKTVKDKIITMIKLGIHIKRTWKFDNSLLH